MAATVLIREKNGAGETATDKTSGRQVAVAAKAGTASGSSINGTNNLHIGLLDSTNSRVVAVTDETSDQSITSGNPVNFPALNWKLNQPV